MGLFFWPFLCSSILKKMLMCTWYGFCFTFLRWAECLKELSCPLKGCWRISTSRRMQTNYASSPGKVKPLFWTSLKPSHQRLSWGDWHCRYFWRRMAGNCTWEPGCTGHFWAGFGWTLFLKERGWRLPRWGAQKTRRDGAILYQINTRCAPNAEQHLMKRLGDLSHMSGSLTTLSWTLNSDMEKCYAFCATYFLVLFKLASLNDDKTFIDKYWISLKRPFNIYYE